MVTERISKNFWLALCSVQRQSWAADACFPPGNLTHDLVCISPGVLTDQLISPTYSQLIALWLDCTHLLYDRLQASCPRCWNREFRGEVKQPLLLFLQKHVRPKQKEGRRRIPVHHSQLPPLQTADTQQFFTGKLYVPVHMLKLPAEELLWSALPRMTGEKEVDGGWWEPDWGRRRFTLSSQTGLARFEPVVWFTILWSHVFFPPSHLFKLRLWCCCCFSFQ